MSTTTLRMYKSEDAGKIWEFVSKIVKGKRNEKHIMGLPVWEPFLLQSPDGSYLTGTPYVAWIDKGGKDGTILAAGRGFSHIFANS